MSKEIKNKFAKSKASIKSGGDSNSININDIAIVGIACRFPGANDHLQFWNNLKNGLNSIREITPDRWDINEFYSPNIDEPNKINSKWCGLIDNLNMFDNRFFNISPREAKAMDPQQRVLLEETYHCIEDSGISLKSLQEGTTSVHVGVSTNDYGQVAYSHDIEIDSYANQGNYSCVLANRISYIFGFSGNSIAIDAACGSSLIALNDAAETVIARKSDYAIAAGVSFAIGPARYISMAKTRMLSPDGQCKTFDKDANGFVPGEGVGILLIQRLEDALKSGTHIYGVIKGWAVNHGGQAQSITAPRVEAQKDLILNAYKEAGFAPSTVSYIEAHGTGTSLGDPIEVEALTQAFRRYTDGKQFCKIGSVKTNIGHLEAASGIAGIIKVLLMFKYKKIPQSLNVKILNPIINFEESPFTVATSLSDWKSGTEGVPLRAGVSSFGFGGSNGHFLLEEYKPQVSTETNKSETNEIFLLSAKTYDNLRESLKKWNEFLNSGTKLDLSLHNTCMTLVNGRENFEYRCGAIVNSFDDIRKFLQVEHTASSVSKVGQRWCLRIGEGTVGNPGVHLLKEISLLNIKLNSVLGHLSKFDKDNSVYEGFWKSEWNKEFSQLYSFIYSYTLISTLVETGVKPELIVVEKSGVWVGIAITKMMDIENILMILANKDNLSKISIRRPSIPFYNQVSNKVIMPYSFDAEYIRLLISGLNVQGMKRIEDNYNKKFGYYENIFRYYIEKARLLESSQFTFKKSLEEWDNVLKQSYFSIKEMLYNDELAIVEGNGARNEKLLLMVIIISSLERLNQKWNLSDPKLIADDRFYEIVELVIDEVLPMDVLVKLITNENPDYEGIADILNLRQNRINSKNLYKCINARNQSVTEIENCSAWLKEMTAYEISNLPGDITAWLNYGTINMNLPTEEALCVSVKPFNEANFKELLMGLWLNGVDIKWNDIYKDKPYKKVSLPGYCFDRQLLSISLSESKKVSCEKLHPLIGQNVSNFREQKFKTKFEVNEFYIKDHIIGSEPVLPGVAYLEMARAAGDMSGEGRVCKIKDIVWQRKISFDTAQKGADTGAVYINLYPSEKLVEFEIWTLPEAADKVVHSNGKLIYEINQDSISQIDFIDIKDIKDKSTTIKNQEECYGLFSSIGFKYGSGFQSIKNLYCNDKEALSHIELPANCRETFNQYVLHPSILDGALQTIIALQGYSREGINTLYLPYILEELEIFSAIPETCYAYVTPDKNWNLSNTGIKKFDIKLIDEAGKILVCLRGLSLREYAQQVTNDVIKTLYFEGVWEQSEHTSNCCSTDSSEIILIFDNDDVVSNSINEQIKNRGLEQVKCILVNPGTTYTCFDSEKYVINPNCKEDYEKLINSLTERRLIPNKIIHMWSHGLMHFTKEALKSEVEIGIISVHYISQALLKQRIQEKVKLLYIFESQNGHSNPHNSAIGGYAKTINLENPNFIYKTVELRQFDDVCTPERLAELIMSEFSNDNKTEVYYEDNKRFVRNYREIQLSEIAEKNESRLTLTDNGVYIITGGAGGLGMIFAEYLVRRGRARIVLTGRSELNSKQKSKIERFKSNGSEIDYIKADISLKESVDELIDKVRSKFGKINGIIHSAGVTRDIFILNKTIEDVEAVLAPKVYGTVFLDHATREEKLDFFIMFSSIAAVLGNMGQSDYSYANSFMDYYSVVRENLRLKGERFGKTISINWPLWQDGGMTMDEASKTWMKNNYGFVSLSTEKGIEAFERLITQSKHNVSVMAGFEGKLKNAIEKNNERGLAESNEKQANSVIDLDSNQINTLRAKTELFLKEILSKQTEYPIDKVNIHEPFEKFGIDSILIMALTRELEKHVGELSKTLFFEYQNLSELTEYFVQNHTSKLMKKLEVLQNDHSEEKSKVVTEVRESTILNRSRFLSKSAINNKEYESEDLVVVGFSGIFPMAESTNEFWENLKSGKDCITEIPSERWNYQDYFNTDKDSVGKTYSKWGGFINDVDKFDPLFFNISPREAEIMDPQERLFMEVVWKTIEDSGNTRSQLEKSTVGVFVGVMYGQYQLFGVENNIKHSGASPGSFYASVANRISYFFNFHGPSMAIDTMCSSSLTAVHLACESIRRGECDIAIAGGVNVTIHPNKYIYLSQGKFTSRDGRCRSFGEGGDGYVPGEGIGAILIKPLRKAIEDRDSIYAVIKGSSVNHGGKTNGYTVPNPNAQANLIHDVFKKSGVDPRTISYIEAHGTGTSLGDPIEISGLVKAFGECNGDKQFCSIGSAKSNIGHLESAAGIAGVIKILLQMKYKKLLPSIHSDRLNPNMNFQNTPFYVQHSLEEWNQPVIIDGGVEKKYPRRAGISAFGAGGSNAHVLFEEYIDLEEPIVQKENVPNIVVLSARNEERLKAYAEDLVCFIDSISNESVINKPNKKVVMASILGDLKTIVAEILNVNKSIVDETDEFMAYGFNLLQITELTNHVNERYNIDLGAIALLEYSNIEEVVEYIYNTYTEIFEHLFGNVKSSNVESVPSEIQISLSEIAYTYLIGRESMEERIAVVVTNLVELNVKLKQYCQGKNNIDGLFKGSVKANKTNFNLLLKGNAGELYIKTLIEGKQLEQLAELWVSGVEIDWRLLFENKLPKIVSLPGYPFAKERYWITEKEQLSADLEFGRGKARKLHPLIDENISTFENQCFKTILTGNEFYLADHNVHGSNILPGVVFVEIARAAGELSLKNGNIFRLSDITWLRPVSVVEKPVELRIDLFPIDKTVEFEVCTALSDKSTQVNATGKLNIEKTIGTEVRAEIENIGLIKNRCDKHKKGEEVYRKLSEIGFKYGNRLRTIKELYHSNNECLAVMQMPSELSGGCSSYVLHPALMDGALQAVSSIFEESDDHRTRFFLPYGIKQIDILKPTPVNCFAYAVRSTKNKFDIKILDDSGLTLVFMKGVEVREVENSNPSHANIQANRNSKIYFTNDWVKQDIAESNLHTLTEEYILVLDKDEEFYESIKLRREPWIKDVILVNPGKKFEIIDNMKYSINPGIEEDYSKLIGELKRKGIIFNKILIVWAEGDFAASQIAITAQINLGIYPLFYLTKAIIEQRLSNKIELLFVYSSYADGNQPLYAALSGFVRTLRNENPNFIYKTLEFSLQDNASLQKSIMVDSIIKEFLTEDDVSYEIRYGSGNRFIKRLNELEINKTENFPLKENGVYIITGGAGGLGLIFAEYLARKIKAKLVLTGRSELSREKQDRIRELETLGAEVEYICADVYCREDIEKLIELTRNRFIKINGIIHSAGVIKDSFIIKKTKKEIDDVLAAKVYGAIWLDDATKDDKLDFFAMFSSSTSIIGNVGQSDYAVGNSFMDNFALTRKAFGRSGKTVSINWPFWKNGGMILDEAGIDYLFESLGLVPLDTDDGINSFEDVLASNESQVIVLNGDSSRIISTIGKVQKSCEANEVLYQTASDKEEHLMERTLSYLKNILSKELRLTPEKIDEDEPMEKYGIDSVMIMGLTKELEKSFGNLSKTLFFEYRSIKELAGYFMDKHFYKLESKFADTQKEKKKPQKPHIAEQKIIPASIKNRFITNSLVQYTDNYHEKDIAIIGLSGKYPMANDLDKFWDNLKNSKDCIAEIPSDRWDYKEFYSPDQNMRGTTNSKWGGFIDDIDKFDPLFFNIAPREAELIDPQERLFLEIAWQAFCDAGYVKKNLDGRKIGVFAGSMYSQYQLFETDIDGKRISPLNSQASIANRVSYYFNLCGPSVSLDTMCSSALTAVHFAYESILRGESEMALAGGVNLSMHPRKYVMLSHNRFTSSDGRCRSFGDGGDGYVPGEGVGAILLKPLDKAVADGDKIYGVIKGSSLNHGGRTNGFTVPNPNAQAEVIADTFKKSGIDPKTISYVEAHGTGTSLGDPIEITGLIKGFGENIGDRQFCPIGSVKSNIGHLESAAGIAAITKVLLQMEHKQLVPSIHSENLNPHISFEETPFFVQQKLEEWKKPKIIENGREKVYPRRASISSFGAGGSNAHIIIEEYNNSVSEVYINDNEKHIIVLSAKNENRLKEYAAEILRFLKEKTAEKEESLRLLDLAYTLKAKREALEERLAIIASNIVELEEILEKYINNIASERNMFTGNSANYNEDETTYAETKPDKNTIKLLIINSEVEKLAKLWTQGVEIDWFEFYKDGLPSIISLPAYPLAKKRYWIGSYQANENLSIVNDKLEMLRSNLSEHKTLIPLRGKVDEYPQGETSVKQYTRNDVVMEIIDGCIAIVKMQDRQNKNMFSKNITEGLIAKFGEINRNPKIKAVIITGYDNIFCMGGTREQLTDISDKKMSFTATPFLYRGLLECEVPVIAAIQGHASGGGLLFGLYSDIIVMSKESVYSAVFMKYGFTPGMGATFILKEKFGSNLATEMMFTAKSFRGEELKNRGASVIFENKENVLKEAVSIARMLSEKPVQSLKVLKTELSGRLLKELHVCIDRESYMHELTFSHPEVKQRIEYYYLDNKGNENEKIEENIIPNKKIKLEPTIDSDNPIDNKGRTSSLEDKNDDGFLEKLLINLQQGKMSPEQAVDTRVRKQKNGGWL